MRLSPYRRSGIFFGFHLHLHILVSDGCYHENGMSSVSPAVDTKALKQIFRHNVLKMLLAKDKIAQNMVALLDKWRHTGFNVFAGMKHPWRIWPDILFVHLSPRKG